MGWWLLFAGLLGFVIGMVVGAFVVTLQVIHYQREVEYHVKQQERRMRP